MTTKLTSKPSTVRKYSKCRLTKDIIVLGRIFYLKVFYFQDNETDELLVEITRKKRRAVDDKPVVGKH